MRHPRTIARLLLALVAIAGVAIVSGPAQATFPGVDGRIAFSDSTTGQIYAINPDGSGLVQLTNVHDDKFAQWPEWSPDGTHIVFDSNMSGDHRLWVMDADGGHKRLVPDVGHRSSDLVAVYTPDGKRLVFTRCSTNACAIYSIGVDGHHRKALTPLQGPPFEVFDYWPSVSPDGKWIAFQRFNQNVNGIISQVYVMGPDGSDPHPITRPRLEAGVPDFSPDGNRIGFTSTCCKLGENIYTMSTDGTDVHKLTSEHFPHSSYASSYSPSGARMAYLNDDAYPDLCCVDLFVMQSDGTQQTLLSTGLDGIQSAAWGTAPLVTADSTPMFTVPIGSPSQVAARLAARCRLLPRAMRVALRCTSADSAPTGER
jgi:Tol biopolymer transport system component